MQINDRLIGALAIVGGVAVIAGTIGFRELPGQQFGSAFFPRIVGAAFILTGIAMILTGKSGAWLQLSDMVRGKAGLQVLSALLAVIAWVIISPHTGFIAATLVLIFVLILIAGGRVLPALATAAFMASLLYLIFGVMLRVPLPLGVIERFVS